MSRRSLCLLTTQKEGCGLQWQQFAPGTEIRSSAGVPRVPGAAVAFAVTGRRDERCDRRQDAGATTARDDRENGAARSEPRGV